MEPQAIEIQPDIPKQVPMVDPTLKLGRPSKALRSIPKQKPTLVTIVDPASEPEHPPPQVLEEEFAQKTTLPQEPGQEAAHRPLNRPLQDLFEDDRRPDFFKICIPMYEASMNGDWNKAHDILADQPYLARCSITDNSETALHVAASTNQNPDFVENLLSLMRNEDMTLQNGDGNTALCLAAMTGNVEIARMLVTRNRDLLRIRNNAGMTPLLIAALYGKRKMVTYLTVETDRDGWGYEDFRWVCLKCVENDLFDIALEIFPKIPVMEDDYAETQAILGVLAGKPSAFDETKKTYLNSLMACFKGRPHANTNNAMPLLMRILTATEGYRKDVLDKVLRGPPTPINTIDDSQPPREINTYPSRILFVAAEMGNTKFIVELIRKYPDFIWKVDDYNRSIFHVAVSRRHQSIYNLLYEINGSMKNSIIFLRDTNENNMLHLAGQMVDKDRLKGVRGTAFQMQRELLWYKEIESMLPASYQERKNRDGDTPRQLFAKTHKHLLSESEKWMKGTATQCMLVATLIATMVFTVAYTVPGGYDNSTQDSKNGFPVFLRFAPFIVFVVLDAISLFLSILSILVFLSILTSHYSQDAFRKSLPDKLMVGLTMLYLSIVTMMIAFSVGYFVLYRHKFVLVAVSISLLALITIISYAHLSIPLMKDVLCSTYDSRYLFKPKKPNALPYSIV